mmetsp:Transcript_2311/g.4499  ORF Transcript_2311/g.4499 Transcript_2311/m.4499 type:complete len:674 (-) Transcript_2311:1577-3598(-)
MERIKDVRCVPLVRQGADEGLELCHEGVAALEAVKKPVHCVCVCGLYRTGKSLFLNHFVGSFGYKVDFQVGNTTTSCTRGIWMCVLEEEGFVVLDTEGLASVDQDETYDCKIFSLGVLISSYFVYNTVGVIDESALDRLYMVGKLAQKISKNHKIAFSLLWLLRDFSLSLEQYSNNANDYFEDALEDKKKRKNNEQRQEIRRIFRNRQCRTLVRPILEESKLQSLSSLPREELRPEFVEQLDGVISLIREKTNVKRMQGQALNGPALAKFVETCLDSINAGAVPDIKKSFQYIAEQTYMEIAQRAEKLYLDKMGAQHVGDWVDFVKLHQISCSEAIELFSEPGTLDTASKSTFIAKTTAKLNEVMLQQWEKCSMQSMLRTQHITDDFKAKYDAGGDAKFSDLCLVEADPSNSLPLGPERHQVVKRFVINEVIEGRLLPKVSHLEALVSQQTEKIKTTEALFAESRCNLDQRTQELVDEQERHEVTRQKLEKKSEDLELSNATAARAQLQLEHTTETLQKVESTLAQEKETLEQLRITLDEKSQQLATESGKVIKLEEQMAKQIGQVTELEDDCNRLREQMQEIIAAAADQQNEFDESMEKMSDERDQRQIELLLGTIIQEIEMSVLQKEKARILEEKRGLQAELAGFFEFVTKLPEFYQDMAFCQERGALNGL